MSIRCWGDEAANNIIRAVRITIHDMLHVTQRSQRGLGDSQLASMSFFKRSLFSCDASESLLPRAAYGKHSTRTPLSIALRPAASSRALDAANIADICTSAHRHHERDVCPRATEKRLILQFAGPFTLHHPEDPEDIPFITLASPFYRSTSHAHSRLGSCLASIRTAGACRQPALLRFANSRSGSSSPSSHQTIPPSWSHQVRHTHLPRPANVRTWIPSRGTEGNGTAARSFASSRLPSTVAAPLDDMPIDVWPIVV